MKKKMILNILAIALMIMYVIVIILLTNHYKVLANSYLEKFNNNDYGLMMYELTYYRSSCYLTLTTSIFYLLFDIITILTNANKQKLTFNCIFFAVKFTLSSIINIQLFVNMGKAQFLELGQNMFMIWCLILLIFTLVDIFVNRPNTKQIK